MDKQRKPPPAPKPALPLPPQGDTRRPSADQRWQRTMRFNWDKGGSRGGRR